MNMNSAEYSRGSMLTSCVYLSLPKHPTNVRTLASHMVTEVSIWIPQNRVWFRVHLRVVAKAVTKHCRTKTTGIIKTSKNRSTKTSHLPVYYGLCEPKKNICPNNFFKERWKFILQQTNIDPGSHRGWEIGFHENWWFSGSMSIYQRVSVLPHPSVDSVQAMRHMAVAWQFYPSSMTNASKSAWFF